MSSPGAGAPKVSVIVCAYNARQYLTSTIGSVFSQTYRDFELIVVDDGSTDGTDELIRSLRDRGPIIYHRQPNAGLGAARNKALELARGELIAIIDHDDLCLPRRLEKQVEAADSHPEAALFFSNSEHFLNDGTIVRRQFDFFNPCDRDLSPGRAAELLLARGNFIDSETAFFRKDKALAVGGFPTWYRYLTDYDFFLKMAALYPLYAQSEVLSRWRVHKDQMTQTAGDTIVRECIALLKQWREGVFLSRSSRHVVDLKIMTYLMRAAARPSLRREFGFGALLGETVRLLPSVRQGPAWAFGRLFEKMGLAR